MSPSDIGGTDWFTAVVSPHGMVSEFVAAPLLRIEKEDTIPLVPAAVNSLNEIVAAAEQPLPQKWH